MYSKTEEPPDPDGSSHEEQGVENAERKRTMSKRNTRTLRSGNTLTSIRPGVTDDFDEITEERSPDGILLKKTERRRIDVSVNGRFRGKKTMTYEWCYAPDGTLSACCVSRV